MKTYIYAIKNVVNNKMYIGSSKSIKNRQYEHFYQLKNNKHHSSHFQKSYNKYGKDKFFFYILEECTIENRKEREIYYINLYKTSERNFGYNTHEPNESNFKCSDKTKQLISDKNISKISIDCYDLLGNFINNYPSINNCARSLNFKSNIISEIINNKRKSYKGYTFVKKGKLFNYVKSSMVRNMDNFYKKSD
jgi:hypothetical protein